MENPFSLSFGKKPPQFISRIAEKDNILNDFCCENPVSQTYIITGVRGSGKTVLMTDIADSLKDNEDWIVLDINPERDILNSIASKLYSNKSLHKNIEAELNLSILGFGVSIKEAPPITDIEDAIIEMLQMAKSKGKKVLLTIDEIANTDNVRIFVSSFQIFCRKNLPIFLLMTGLYENIKNLQNEKTLTFLYRAPKIKLSSLNISSVAGQYKYIFDCSEEEAIEMALLTKGYPFAFQVEGYLLWQSATHKCDRNFFSLYDEYLQSYVYEKLWQELSKEDKKVLKAMSKLEENGSEIKVKSIRKKTDFDSGKFSVYRKRLIDKGLIISPDYGYLAFALPRFGEYLKFVY